MSDHKINGKNVSQGDWISFETFIRKEFPSAEGILEDGVVTEKEITGMLDADKDGRFFDDLPAHSSQFKALNEMLQKHGFNIGNKTGAAVDLFSAHLVPSYMWKNRDFVHAAAKGWGGAIALAQDFTNDKEIVLASVKINGFSLEYASDSLRRDPDIVLAAVKDRGEALQYADPSLQKDREIVLAAVRQNGFALEYADESLRMDREIVLAAVNQDGRSLGDAHPSLRDDRDIVLAAVNSTGDALRFAGDAPRKDPEIALVAVRQYAGYFEYVDDSLKRDKALVIAAVSQNGYVLHFADDSLRRDPEIILAAVKESGQVLSHVEDQDKSLEIVLAAVKQDGMALKYARNWIREKRNGFLDAIKDWDWAFVSPKERRTVVLGFVKRIGGDSHPEEWGYGKNGFALAGSEMKDPSAFFAAYNWIQEEKMVASAALLQNRDAGQYIEDKEIFQTGPEVFNEVASLFIKRGLSISKYLLIQHVKLSRFEDFNPPPPSREQSFHDPFVRDYFTKYGSIDTMLALDKGQSVDPQEPLFEDYGKFKSDVLAVAGELGFNAENIASLSIHDAVMLCGRILAKRMEYAKDMIGKKEDVFFGRKKITVALDLIMSDLSGQKIDLRNERARDIDAMPIDRLFAGGAGICRNYARLNVGVFRVIKELNRNLSNTFMVQVSPDDNDHNLPHAWNMVSTLNGNDVDVTYVDPTWLDTRNKTATNAEGGFRSKESDESAYNAYDKDHYEPLLYWAKFYLADFYAAAAKGMRNKLQSNYATDDVLLPLYRDRAFDLYIGAVQDLITCARTTSDSETRRKLMDKAAGWIMSNIVESLILNDAQLDILRMGCPLDQGDQEGYPMNYQNVVRRLAKLKQFIIVRMPELMNSSLKREHIVYKAETPEYQVVQITLNDVFDWFETYALAFSGTSGARTNP